MVYGTSSRREVLTASGLIAIGSLTGCLDRVAATATNTGASPAAMFGGVRDDRLLPVTPGDTVRYSPTVRLEEQFLSGEVELEAWVTNTTTTAKAQDYNSVRSNKRRSSFVGEPTDDEDDSDEHLRRSIERLQSLTDASDDDIAAMYEYLEDDPVVCEQAVITLPDARVPRGGATLEELITPNRVIQFVTGRVDGEGQLYSWGKNEYDTLAAAEDEPDEDDEDDESCTQTTSGGGLSTENQLWCWGSGSATAISEPIHTYGGLEVLRAASGVGIINSPPVATDEQSKIGVTADGQPTSVDDLDDWGQAHGPASSTSTIVCQVLVQPAGCPSPFPALLHVQRHKNNDQYIYSCGWMLDESCLYANSRTVITATRNERGQIGTAVFVDVPVSADGDITGETVRSLLTEAVSPIGSQLFDGSLGDAQRTGVLSDELAQAVAETVSADGDMYCVCRPFDGSCLHLVDDGTATNTVKFKAGAELSKSVN